MSVSSSLVYALLCVYYASRTTLLFFVEMLLFLPVYYLVERQDIPSVWLGRRGEAQVQPVHSPAYLSKKEQGQDVLNGSCSVGVTEMSAGVELRSDGTQKVADNVCILSRKAVGRIRSLHTEKESWWWWWRPRVPHFTEPLSASRFSDTPHQRQEQRLQPIPPSFNSRPRLPVMQSEYDGGPEDGDNVIGAQRSCPHDMKATMPREGTSQQPSSFTLKDSVQRSGLTSMTLKSATTTAAAAQSSEGIQWLQSPLQLRDGGDVHEQDVFSPSFTEGLNGSAGDVVDGDRQPSYVTDAFFCDVEVSVRHSAEDQRQERDRSASLRGCVSFAKVKCFLSSWSRQKCGAAARKVSASSESVPATTATVQERLCATVPAWCTVVFRSRAPQPATHGGLPESASSYFRGQYGFLPPWYAVHARAQLLLALADPVLRIAAEVLCCRGWVAPTESPAEPTRSEESSCSIDAATATAVWPGEGQQCQNDTRAAPPPSLEVPRLWQDFGTFHLGPLLLCFRALRGLVFMVMRLLGAAPPPRHDAPRMSASPLSRSTFVSGGVGGVHLLGRLEAALKAHIYRYTMDTHHSLETLHTEEAAPTTVLPLTKPSHVGGNAPLSTHGLSEMATSRVTVPRSVRPRDPGAACSLPLSPASGRGPACRRSVGVHWLHGRRPPMWSAAPPENRCSTPSPHPPSPTLEEVVVVVLLCPSLLQGSGLYSHTVARLGHLCQLLTLVGAWQSGLATDRAATPGCDGDGDRASHPSVGDFLTKTTSATRSRGNSTRSHVLPGATSAGEEKRMYATANPHTSRGIPTAGAEVNSQPSPQLSWQPPPSATRPAPRPAVQWYAAVPVVELRVPATSRDGGGGDDVSMPPLTLKDLRRVVRLLRCKLESGSPPPRNYSMPCPSNPVGNAACPSPLGQPLSHGTPAEVTSAQRPPRQVYIVAVGWSEAASPLLELAITQQQQQQTSAKRGADPRCGEGGGLSAQPPAHLDGVVCLSHTLSSAFQLLPEQHAQTLVLEQSTPTTSLPVSSSAHVSLANTTGSGDGSSGASSPLTASASSPSPAMAGLHASLHMPRILSRLTTGPARLLLLLTRMQLIADGLLSHRQHQEKSQRGGVVVNNRVRLPEASGVHWPVGAPMLKQPKYTAQNRAGASPSVKDSAQTTGISFYHILHLFREAREEVNRAQSGLSRASATWVHHHRHQQQQRQQQQLLRLLNPSTGRDAGFDVNFPTSTGSLSAVVSRASDRRVELGLMRGAAPAPHSQPTPGRTQFSPLSSASAGSTCLPGKMTTNALPQHSLHAVSFSKFAHQTPLSGSLASTTPMAPSINVAAPKAFVGSSAHAGLWNDTADESNANIAPTFGFTNDASGMLPPAQVDHGTPPSHDRDLLQDSSVSWALPRLETAMDWEELARTPLMAEVQQQQRREVANTTANDLPSLSSVNNATQLSSSGRPRRFQSSLRFEGERGGPTANEPAAAAPSPFTESWQRVSRVHMSTDDVIASCTLQVVSPTHWQVNHFPGKEATKASQTASTPHNVPLFADYRERSSDPLDHATAASAVDQAYPTSLATTFSIRSNEFSTALVSDRGFAERVHTKPLSGSESLPSEEFGSFNEPPALSVTSSVLRNRAEATPSFVRSATLPSGDANGLCVMGAGGEQGNIASSRVPSSTGREPILQWPATPATPPVSHCNPSSGVAQLPSTVLMPPLQPQKPIPYPAPSRAPALSPQTAALVELRVRSAQHAALVQRIAIPTLLIHARDDPVAPTSTLPFSLLQANPWITTVLTRRGSHAVYMEGVAEVWRRPRLVVTEQICQADTERSSCGTDAAGDKVYWPGHAFDDENIEASATARPRRYDSLSVSSSRKWSNASPMPELSPTTATSPETPALRATARPQEFSSFLLKGNSRRRGGGNGTGCSSITISNSSPSDDSATDDGDSGDDGVVEWLHDDREPEGKSLEEMRHVTSPRRLQAQQSQRVAVSSTCQWKARIEGTTWLERLIFEYVEKAILWPAATSTSLSSSTSPIV
ncbi:uncharacterized protein JKF63_07968 [Porcisia hertigi]|uniref:Uncharacterized protein n=1 Tax=Porcisia hertigi TaxID=2761500 RepID=A0A836HVG6_9TRYP|nr:hypothetical protein JKF63_07968 [Porcisia hertigi]